ncbi:MAG TPA: DUF883 family protein [Lacunisphaera sp.]|nr:DUF883 family protein [Lacunisphaera sp.]
MDAQSSSMDDNPGRAARERVMADLKTLAADAEALLRATASDASDKATEARARLNATVEKVRATCAELQERGVEGAREAVRKADDTIRAHPYESIAVAFGVGVLLGVVLQRK